MQLAETIGIPLADVHSLIADTDQIPFTNPTGGSRVTFSTGLAAHNAGKDLVKKIAAVLAGVWGVNAKDIAVERGGFTSGAHAASFRDAARELEKLGLQVVGTASVFPTGFGPAFATHIVDVEVDDETGKVRILRSTAVQDAGKAIYPPYVEGQIQGGVAQGVGWALSEGYVYDDQGHMRNSSLLDYRMPTALDLPMIDTVIVEVPNPNHPYGVRGVGEVGIVPPPAAIASAIANAVGTRLRDLPMSPARVHAAIAAHDRAPVGV
jgi:CO/xanthine dehydrogenase Mo-binding subunit